MASQSFQDQIFSIEFRVTNPFFLSEWTTLMMSGTLLQAAVFLKGAISGHVLGYRAPGNPIKEPEELSIITEEDVSQDAPKGKALCFCEG